MADDINAEERLEAALQRLETASGHLFEVNVRSSEQVDELKQNILSLDSEMATFRLERNALNEELTVARSNCSNLRCAVDEVTVRLDQAIIDVRTILEE